ncbi:MAG: DUF4870 domain-containing protein [Micrococcales bacterium]|nr:DUF4870 domain-containing protein [Micrococcales bacterium]
MSQPPMGPESQGPGAPPPPGQPYGQPQPAAESEQRTWALLAHLSGILSIIATVIVWVVFKDKGDFIRDQATEALNFQILVTAYSVVAFIITLVTLGIGGILYLAVIAALVFMIMGALAANKGERYRYPVNWRLIK